MKKKNLLVIGGAIFGTAVSATIISKVLNNREKKDEEFTDDNMDRALGNDATFYEKYVKRVLDVGMSFCGIVLLSPVMALASATVYLEDPGNIIFTQKRVGINKTYFNIHKIRSMRMDTPDLPTHLMKNPERYILKTGKVYRKLSIDELYQLFDILRGRMSIVGPRPALWNQDDLVAERDKYGANSVRPGLTGWAQINGRDELEIPIKAKLDGEYCRELRRNSLAGFKMDCKCFFGTFRSVLNADGVVEGGTGKLEKEWRSDKSDWVGTSPTEFKKILITGKDSYIGENVKKYLEQFPEYYQVDIIETKGLVPTKGLFEGYKVVINAAGIAHIKETDKNKDLYYSVNRDLCVDIAEKAKEAGVKQFIVLSSMSVYGLVTGHIMKYTEPEPKSAYGDSKMQADLRLQALETPDFKVAILRPPMVYGKGCKGNYQLLRKFASKSPVFVDCQNERSMIYIGNLCEYIKNTIDMSNAGVFFPQNAEYVSTSNMVKLISRYTGKNILMIPIFSACIKRVPMDIVKKVFGDLTYERTDLINKYPFEESIRLSEE